MTVDISTIGIDCDTFSSLFLEIFTELVLIFKVKVSLSYLYKIEKNSWSWIWKTQDGFLDWLKTSSFMSSCKLGWFIVWYITFLAYLCL